MEDTSKNQNIEEKVEKEETNTVPVDSMMKFIKKDKKGDSIKEVWDFWDKQPVPKFNSAEIKEEDIGPIDKESNIETERKEPFNLPKGHVWYELSINKDEELTKLYEFLRDNYVEDEDHMFRFDYSKEFLKWHLTAPGYLKQWHLCIIKETTKEMVGFISAIPVHINVFEKENSMVEINFLCVKHTYRTKRMAAVLIKEITRRVHMQNIWQAVYTAGALLPRPISTCTYYHRNLNIKKLLDVKFTYLNPHMNISRAKSIYKIAKDTTIDGLRPMEKRDVEGVFKILNKYLKNFKVRSFYSLDEVEHWFMPRKNVIYSFVVENYNTGEITDFISFYSLPSSILNHEVHKTLYAAYSFFNVATSVSFKELMRNALILANSNKFDVFNCLNVMDNETVFKDLLFGQGDGSLKYYFYNYACPEVKPNELSIVLM